MLVSPKDIAPSQDFLKEKTIRFILACLHDGNTDDLPPKPLVRKDDKGDLIAIDGHNLIAVRFFRGEAVDVIVAESPSDGLPPTTKANRIRNEELAAKFNSVLNERDRVAAEGILSFADLVAHYPDLFGETNNAFPM